MNTLEILVCVCERKREERGREEGSPREHDDPHWMRAKNPVDAQHCLRPTTLQCQSPLRLGFHRFLCKVPSLKYPEGGSIQRCQLIFLSLPSSSNCLQHFPSKTRRGPLFAFCLFPLPNPSWSRRGFLNTAFPSTLGEEDCLTRM